MDTADGRYLSFDMANPVDMNSASIGIPPGSPGYYNELVYDAVQFTMSGGDAVLASASGSQFVPGSMVTPSTASGPAAPVQVTRLDRA